MTKFIFKPKLLSLIVCLCTFMALPNYLVAQSQSVSGKVIDWESGEPLIGVNVLISGTISGTVTDIDGNYSLTVPGSDNVLIYSFIGYLTDSVTVGAQTVINVSLMPDISTLQEVVVVGYGTQRRQSVTAAVSQIRGDELLKAPVSNLTNALSGRISGVSSLQTSGQPGADGASIRVRGTEAKYIVDGIERPFAEIDPNTIETISVLKDASSAAIYGLDADAVIIVTTKRGKDSPSRISATATYGISSNAVMTEMLDGPGYAYWYNKAREMDGDTPIFTSEHVQKMLNDDPTDGWGNTDWYKKTFDVGRERSFNINATGGTDKLKYFVSLGNYNQEGNVKGFDYNRINLRSNIDAVIANNLDLRFDISGRIEDRKRPGFSANPADWNNIPQQAMRAHPYVPHEIDGIPVSTRTSSSYVSPFAASDLSGYRNEKTNLIETNLGLNYNVPFIKGLSAKFLTAYDISYHNSKAFNTPYYTYVASLPTASSPDISYGYTHDARGVDATMNEGLTHWSKLTTNTSLNYDNKFGKHSISAIALLETIRRTGNSFAAYGYGFSILELDELDYASLDEKNNVGGSSSEATSMGIVGRINYEYDHKYLAEVSVRRDGSYIFGGMVPGKRWATFPAASLGWRISQEDWFRNLSLNFVDELKLRGGIGLTGKSEIDPYHFLSTIAYLKENDSAIPAVVLDGAPQPGLVTSQPGNPNLTWAKTLQYNGGFDAYLFNGALNVEFDVFYKYIYDMLSVITASFPDSYGGYVFAYENKNKQDIKGFDFTISHNRKAGDLNYTIGFNGTYAKRRWLLYTDSENTPDWLKQTGKEVGAKVGFIADGLFQSEEEIANSPLIEGKDVRVGDIKYVDRNGDGVISYEQDRGFVGKSSLPKFVAGFTFDADWKGFDFSVLFQAGLNRDVALTGLYPNGVMDHTSMTRPFYHGGNSPVYLVENSWTEENTSAEFPRLSVVPASSNNAYSSTYWYRNGDYLRLKTMQIGYSFPQLRNGFIQNLRVYVQGRNLLTFSGLNKFNIDPETPDVSNGFYPQQRVVTMGVNLTF